MKSISNLSMRIILILPFALLFAVELHAISFEGEFKQGGLLIGQVQEGQTVSYQGKTLKLTTNNQFLLGLGRNAPAITTVILNSQDKDPKPLPLKLWRANTTSKKLKAYRLKQ